MSNRILLIDDDLDFSYIFQKGLCSKGYEVDVATTAEAARALIETKPYQFATLDLNLGTFSGLELIPHLLAANSALKILVITGFASLGTAVQAIKLGAHHYLAKPIRVADVLAYLSAQEFPAQSEKASSLDLIEWERIQETLHGVNFNITKAAAQLGLSRRTLQRKLKKNPLNH